MEADVYSKLDKDGAKKMIKDINGKLVTEKEVVLKARESYSKEVLNKEGNNNDEELPMDVEGKEKLTEITDIEMQRCETSQTRWSECLEKRRGSHVGQKCFEKAEREIPEYACYTGMPVYLETVALTEQQQPLLQICENNWVHRI